MKVAILGAGKQAFGALFYLYDKGIEEIVIGDYHITEAENLVKAFEASSRFNTTTRLRAIQLDAHDQAQLDTLLKPVDAAFNALPYYFGLEVTKAAIRTRTNLVDLGGNNDIVVKQFELSWKAREAGITIIPDCGLAPGLVSILVADIMQQAKEEQVHSIKIYVGGLPQNRDTSGLLQYGESFSIEGLVNEYTQPVHTLRHGKLHIIEPLSEQEDFSVEKFAWMSLEAFATSGGISTLPETFRNKVQTLEYKTLRFPGHLRMIKLLQKLDQLNPDTLGKLIKPQSDQIILHVDARSSSNTARIRRQYSLHQTDYSKFGSNDIISNLSAMMQGTAFPAAALLLMISDSKQPGYIEQQGVLKQECVANPRAVINELRRWLNIHLEITIEE